MAREYTAALRRQWVLDNLALIEAEGWTYKIIKGKIRKVFGKTSGISDNTIYRDLTWAREKLNAKVITEEDAAALDPENFPQWREDMFGYSTSKTQHALFYMLRCLALKEEVPLWVLDHFELPHSVNDDILRLEKLMTFILLMAPRHGKTMTMVHGLINLYCAYPNLRVIYCQGVATTTEAINEMIMMELEDEDSKLFKVYGPFRSEKKRWSVTKGFILARRTRQSVTASFQPVGITSNVRSLDADILIIDDPQDLERAESETSTTKDYRKITVELMTRREPHTPVLGVGSHLPTEFGDVWSQIEENLDDIRTEGQEIFMNKRPAHWDEQCQVFDTRYPEVVEHWDCLEWPEYRSYKFLMAQKALLGEELYDAVYQQDARMEGIKPFPPDVIKGDFMDGGVRDRTRSYKKKLGSCPKQIDGTTCNGELYSCIGFDPARGKSRGSSFTALAVLQGCITCLTFYLIDYHFERVSSDEHPDMINSFAKAFKPQMVRIEINAYQEALARNKEVLSHAQRNNYLIDEWETDDRKNTPELGIPMLANSTKYDQFSVPYQTDEDIEYGRELEKSFIRYPKKPNDIPMAVWLAAGGVRKLWDLYADLDPIYLTGRQANVPAYMLDNPLKVIMSTVGDDGE